MVFKKRGGAMVLSKIMLDALNKQLNNELYSAYLYLSMAAYCDDKSLVGFAHWLKEQVKEEQGHGMKIYNYITDRDQRVELLTIPKPPCSWKSVKEIFAAVYEHEQNVTTMLETLFGKAKKENDNLSETFLHGFLLEQIEEESTAKEILDRVILCSHSGEGLLLLDQELSKRA